MIELADPRAEDQAVSKVGAAEWHVGAEVIMNDRTPAA
jgi:hypothetical protein